MKKHQKYLTSFLIGLALLATPVLAQSTINKCVELFGSEEEIEEPMLGRATATYNRSLLPEVTDIYDIGTSTLEWNGVFNNMTINGTCTGCGDGAFPWTPTTNYGALANSTSTALWFKDNIFSSTTAYLTNSFIKKAVYDPEGDQVVTSTNSTIMAADFSHYMISTTTDTVLASTPIIPDGTDGQILFLYNTSTTATVDLQDEGDLSGSNIIINGASPTIKSQSMMTLFFDDTAGAWIVISNPVANVAGANATTIQVRNTSGSAITAGSPVYVTGYNVGQNRITVDLADADDPSKMPAIGLTATAINTGQNGDVIASGNAVGVVNTAGQPINTAVYVGTTAGTLVFTRPALDTVQKIGIVTRTNASGNVLIQGAGRTNDVPYTLGSYTQPLLNIYASSTAYLDYVTSTALSTDTLCVSGTCQTSVGDVTKVGTPLNKQVGVYTGDGTLEGTQNLLFDGTDLIVDANANGASLLKIGESTTPRGDLQDGNIQIFGEQAGAISTVKLANTGTNLQIQTIAGTSNIQLIPSAYAAVQTGKEFRIYDAGNTDFVAMSHDGTNAKFAFTNTASTDFSGSYGYTFYNAVNDGNVQLRVGASDAEELHLKSQYKAGTQVLDYAWFLTDTASADADAGSFKFSVDAINIVDIDDGGIVPFLNDTYDLGQFGQAYMDVYVSSTMFGEDIVLPLAGAISLDGANQVGEFIRSDADNQFNFYANGGEIARITQYGFDLTNSKYLYLGSSYENVLATWNNTAKQLTTGIADTYLHWVITSLTNVGNDFVHPNQSDPTIFLHSNTAAASATDEWLSLAHNKTNGVMDTGKGLLEVKAGAFSDEIVTSTLAVIEVDLAQSNRQVVILDSAGHTLNFINEEEGQGASIVVCQDGTGSRTITTYDAEIMWAGGSAPTLTATADHCDLLTFAVTNATTTQRIFGSSVLNFGS